MKKLTLFFVLVLMFVAVPAAAQSRSVDVVGFATWVDLSGEGTFEDDNNSLEDFETEFESDMGYGGAINIFIANRLSVELAASVISPEVNVASGGAVSPLLAGDLEMMPITGTLQFHLAPDARIDPYIGAGVAYILFDDLDGRDDIDDVTFEAIEFEDDYGFVVNAGIDLGLTEMIALNVDGKYVPVESAARARFASGPGQETQVDVNPLMLSAGIRLRF